MIACSNKTSAVFLIICIAVLSSCSRRAFYVSPYSGNHNPYHPIPLKEDSVKSAYYAGASISNGTANDWQKDETLTFFTSFSGAHNFGSFQGFYAANVSLGNYKIAPFSSNEAGNFDPSVVNENAGNKFFGSTGIDGGINIVIPIRNGEWRFLGIETSVQQEFGSYSTFRQKLTDRDANFVVKNKFFATLGGYTEIVGGIRHGSIGIRLASGSVLGAAYHLSQAASSDLYADKLSYHYFNFTFHLTKRKVTGYVQANFSFKSQSAFLGANYRLGKNKGKE